MSLQNVEHEIIVFHIEPLLFVMSNYITEYNKPLLTLKSKFVLNCLKYAL